MTFAERSRDVAAGRHAILSNQRRQGSQAYFVQGATSVILRL
jgi:hypothetical protein